MIIYEPRRSRRKNRGIGWQLLVLVLIAAGVWYVLAYPAQPTASSTPGVATVPPASPPPVAPATPASPAASPSVPTPANEAAAEPESTTPARRTIQKAAPEAPRAPEPLQLTELAIVTEQNVRYVVGVVTDKAGVYYQYVSVKLALFDSSGTRLGDIFLSNGNTNQRLDPYGTWRFRAVLADPRAVSCELTELSGH